MRFLLVDRIDEVQPDLRITGAKNASLAEDYFEWHFPERPIVPGVLVLEAFAQLAGWLEALSSDFERWFLLDRVESARYYDFAVPGDVLELELSRKEADDGRRAYEGTSRMGGRRGAVVAFSGRIVPLAGLEDPARMREVCSWLRRQEAPR